MAKQPKKLKVVVTQNAAVDLAEIWVWNARRYDFEHAEGYADFLERESKKLSEDHNLGRSVQGFRDLRYLTLKKGRGHGHVVVFRVAGDSVQIVHYFHTSQDWQSKLAEEF